MAEDVDDALRKAIALQIMLVISNSDLLLELLLEEVPRHLGLSAVDVKQKMNHMVPLFAGSKGHVFHIFRFLAEVFEFFEL